MNLLTNEESAKRCQARLVECCQKTSISSSDHTVQFNPRSLTSFTYFFGDFWIMPTDGKLPDKIRNRYWNALGLGSSPPTASRSIAIEINYPHDPARVSTGGKFLSDGENYFLGHNGVLGGGLKGGRAHSFISKYSEKYDKVQINGRDLFIVAELQPSNAFVEAVRKFVFDMAVARSSDRDD